MRGLFIVVALFGCVTAQLTCVGVTSSLFDNWCNDVCNHNPADCSTSFCSCVSGTPPTSSNNLVCESTAGYEAIVPDSFCQTICTHVPSYCPSNMCRCVVGPVDNDPGTATPISDQTLSCCTGDTQYLFYSTPSGVYKHQVGTTTSTLCYSFIGGLIYDMVIDSNDNLYMADPITSAIYRGSTNCDDSTLTHLTNFHTNQLIDAPVSLAIADGVLLVGGHHSIYAITFSDTDQITDIEVTPVFNATSSTDMVASSDGTGVYFVAYDHEEAAQNITQATIAFFNAQSGTVTPYSTFAQHGNPDVEGLAMSSCGLFFTSIVSDRLYLCPDLTNGSSCAVYCSPSGLNADSCTNLHNPTRVTTGCCCDTYVTNTGSGMITRFTNAGNGTATPPVMGVPEITGLYHPTAIVSHVPRVGGICSSGSVCNSD